MTDAQLAAWLARVLRGRAAQSPQATARRPVAPLHDHTEPGRVAEAGEAGTSDARSFARHEPPQPDDAGRALSPSAEAAGRQPFSAGFHTTPPPPTAERTSVSCAQLRAAGPNAGAPDIMQIMRTRAAHSGSGSPLWPPGESAHNLLHYV